VDAGSKGRAGVEKPRLDRAQAAEPRDFVVVLAAAGAEVVGPSDFGTDVGPLDVSALVEPEESEVEAPESLDEDDPLSVEPDPLPEPFRESLPEPFAEPREPFAEPRESLRESLR